MRECLGGKPMREMKVKGASSGVLWCEVRPLGCSAASTDHDSPMKDSSLSVYVGTRKMVNYA